MLTDQQEQHEHQGQRLNRIAQIIEAADERAGCPDDPLEMVRHIPGTQIIEIYQLAKGLK
jgi:hypothetical protein